MVAADLDVGGHEVRNTWIGSAEQHVLSRRLQIVIHNLKRPGAIPDSKGLCIKADPVNIGDIGIDHCGAAAVHRDAALDVPGRGAVDVAPVKCDVRGELSERRGWIAAR